MRQLSFRLFLASLIIFMSACETSVLEDPQIVLNKAWQKQIDKQEKLQKGTLDFSGRVQVSFDKNQAQLSGKGRLAFDSSSEKSQKAALNLDLKGNGTIDGKKASASLSGETRFVDNKMFVKIDDLKLSTNEPKIDIMANVIGNYYKSQWVELPLDIFKAPGLSLYNATNPKGKELHDIARDNPVLDVTKDLGKRTYEVVVNPEKLNRYLDEISRVDPASATPESKEAIQKFFSESQYTATVKISRRYEFEAVNIAFQSNDPESDQSINVSFGAKIGKKTTQGKGNLEYAGATPGNLQFEFKTTEKSKKAVVEAPVDAQTFDLGALGAFMGEEEP